MRQRGGHPTRIPSTGLPRASPASLHKQQDGSRLPQGPFSLQDDARRGDGRGARTRPVWQWDRPVLALAQGGSTGLPHPRSPLLRRWVRSSPGLWGCPLHARVVWHQEGMWGLGSAGEEQDLLQISRVRKSPQAALQLQTTARLELLAMLHPQLDETPSLPPCSPSISVQKDSGGVNPRLPGWGGPLQDCPAAAWRRMRSAAPLASAPPRRLRCPGALLPFYCHDVN